MENDILNLQAEIINKLSSKILTDLDNYFIDGLKTKGFEFGNRFELEEFVKENCRCEDNPFVKERVYFVKNIPFLLHKYDDGMNLITTIEEGSFGISANFGSFIYL